MTSTTTVEPESDYVFELAPLGPDEFNLFLKGDVTLHEMTEVERLQALATPTPTVTATSASIASPSPEVSPLPVNTP